MKNPGASSGVLNQILRNKGFFGASGFMVENDEFRAKYGFWDKFCFIAIPILIVFSALFIKL
jgi:hypothetical protein